MGISAGAMGGFTWIVDKGMFCKESAARMNENCEFILDLGVLEKKVLLSLGVYKRPRGFNKLTLSFVWGWAVAVSLDLLRVSGDWGLLSLEGFYQIEGLKRAVCFQAPLGSNVGCRLQHLLSLVLGLHYPDLRPQTASPSSSLTSLCFGLWIAQQPLVLYLWMHVRFLELRSVCIVSDGPKLRLPIW